jgi:hypothetical protein
MEFQCIYITLVVHDFKHIRFFTDADLTPNTGDGSPSDEGSNGEEIVP